MISVILQNAPRIISVPRGKRKCNTWQKISRKPLREGEKTGDGADWWRTRRAHTFATRLLFSRGGFNVWLQSDST